MKDFTTLVDILAKQSNERPDHVIYRFMEWKDDEWYSQNVTFGDVYRQSLAMASTLRDSGLRAGDRAIILCMQDFGTVCAAVGCMMAGVTFAILPPPLDEGKIERLIAVLRSCSPKALISNYALEQASGVHIAGRMLRSAPAQTLRLKRIYTDRLNQIRGTRIIVPAKADDIVYLQYTSGSTSSPKGVCVTWKALMKNIDQCRSLFDFNGSCMGSWVPFFHNLGLLVTICMALTTSGGCVYLLSTMQFLENPKLWIRMMSDFNLDLTVGPGSAFDACTRIFTSEEAARFPLPHVTHFMNGSEFISAKTNRRFAKLFSTAPDSMAPGYGLSEAVCLVTFADRDYRTLLLDHDAYQDNRAVITDDPSRAKEVVSVGAPVKDLKVVIAHPKSRKVLPDLCIGEIYVSGDNVAKRYWGKHRENANFHIRLHGCDGEFYKTGDMGFLHKGHLYITGRAKEMLIVNGHNIYPVDLCLLLQRKVAAPISALAFFSIQGDTKESIVAVAESAPGKDFVRLSSQISRAVSERFAFSFYDIVFVPPHTLPHTDSGKLQIAKIRDLYRRRKLNVLFSSRAYRSGHKPAPRSEPKSDAGDEILRQVKSVFEKVLRIEQFSLSDSFLELGGDSLMGFELVQRIEERFSLRLDLREVLRDASVFGISDYIRHLLSGKSGEKKPVNLIHECRLGESIAPSAPYRKPAADCRRIFLTGATGFLGARLIHALLTKRPGAAADDTIIYCLVRADSDDEGMRRIVQNLRHYKCWDEAFRPHIRAVAGDLSKKNLGLDGASFEELSRDCEIIYHGGALLNFVFPYEYLRETNVRGTIETLRLACAGNPKYYNYVSSYSVYDTPNHKGEHVYEDDPLKVCNGFSLAYSETKWVSEKLVRIAGRRGLRAMIYRPGDITGAKDGIWDVSDMVSRMLVSMIQMRAVPRSSYRLHMTPVDYVADAMVYISDQPNAPGGAYNLVNPKSVPLPEIVDHIRSCGYPVRYIPFRTWRGALRRADAASNAMALLECLFEAGSKRHPGILRRLTGRMTTYDTSNAERMLTGSGISCPPIDRAWIRAYLNYFKKRGCIS